MRGESSVDYFVIIIFMKAKKKKLFTDWLQKTINRRGQASDRSNEEERWNKLYALGKRTAQNLRIRSQDELEAFLKNR